MPSIFLHAELAIVHSADWPLAIQMYSVCSRVWPMAERQEYKSMSTLGLPYITLSTVFKASGACSTTEIKGDWRSRWKRQVGLLGLLSWVKTQDVARYHVSNRPMRPITRQVRCKMVFAIKFIYSLIIYAYPPQEQTDLSTVNQRGTWSFSGSAWQDTVGLT